MNFGRWHSTYPINESDDRFSAGQRCGQCHLIREGLAFRTFPPSPPLYSSFFSESATYPYTHYPGSAKFTMCSILWSNPWGNDNSHASPQYGPNIYTGFRSTAKRKKNFPVLVRSPLPLVYQSGEFLCFLLGFFFGHLILGSTSLGSVQNHMTFAWHWQCRIVQGNARSVYFVRFVNSSSESRPKCWPFLLRCSLWLLSTRRDPYHAVSSNILFYFFFIPLILFVHRSMLSWSFFYSHANEVRTFTEELN